MGARARIVVRPLLSCTGAVALAAALGVAPHPARADDPPADERPAATAPAERYVGVSPDAHPRNPLPLPARRPAKLVWTGFELQPKGSRVFFQTVGAVAYDVAPRNSTTGASQHVSVFLRNCRIHLANNRRNLDTRFFATPVAGVTARQRRHDVELEIVLKEPVNPNPRTEPGPDGTQFLVFDFPPGTPANVATDERVPRTAANEPDGASVARAR